MKTFSRFLLSAGFALAIASTFSCSGDDGKDGRTPEISIGANGNWFIDGADTGVNAQGKDGTDGKAGSDGKDGTDGKDGGDGKDGAAGEPGASFCGSEVYNLGTHFCDTDKGVTYTFVEIGGQTWMAENLKSSRAANGFTWAEATADGVCPPGWSLPSKADFDALVLEEDFADSWEGTGIWWSSTEIDERSAFVLDPKDITLDDAYKTNALKVRCLKD